MINSSTFYIYLNRWRGFGGFEELISEWDFKAWKGLENNLSRRQYSTSQDGLVTIEVDWSNPVERARKKYHVYQGKQEDVKRYYLETPLDELTKNLCCTAKVWSDKEEHIGGMDYLKYFLYECFLIMNLSSPGSFNLYMSYIQVDKKEGLGKSYCRDREDLICSEYIFENALHDSLNYKWPTVQYIDFEKVSNWYLSQDTGIVQVAKTRLQKSLFSLLHISERGMGPDGLMWCAYCLEALFDTPNALSFNFLVNRLSELLTVPARKKKKLSKNIRDFYNHRNAFAHGNSKVSHPIGHEGWDKNVDKYRTEIQSACDFATLVIIASLQQYILRNISEVCYVETSQYVPASNLEE